MAEIERLLAQGQVQFASLDVYSAARRAQQPRNQSEQGGFACPVRSGHEQCLSRPDRKAHIAEHLAGPSHAGEVGRSNAHQPTIPRMDALTREMVSPPDPQFRSPGAEVRHALRG